MIIPLDQKQSRVSWVRSRQLNPHGVCFEIALIVWHSSRIPEAIGLGLEANLAPNPVRRGSCDDGRFLTVYLQSGTLAEAIASSACSRGQSGSHIGLCNLVICLVLAVLAF